MNKGEIYINYKQGDVAYIERAIGKNVDCFSRPLSKFELGDSCNFGFFADQKPMGNDSKPGSKSLTFSKSDVDWKLFKPKTIRAGQIWEGVNWPADGKLHIKNWDETFKIRISATKGDYFKSVIVHSPSDKFNFDYGEYYSGAKINLENFGWRIVSLTPKCYYCLCYLNENYLPLSLNKKTDGILVFKCVACVNNFKF